LFGNHHTNIHIGRFKSPTTIIDDLIIRSPLVLAVEETLEFIKKNIRLGFEFGGDGLSRKEKWQYPIPALRELILNAIVHRDYNNTTDLMIKIFDDSILFSNPGGFIDGISVDDILTDDYQPRHRNKLLAEAFYLIGDIEKYGTGFIRLRKWLTEYPNLLLEVNDIDGFTRVELKNTEKVTEKVTKKVTENQQKILGHIQNNNEISTRQLAELLGISQRKVKENISKLKDKGIVERIGPAKGGHWKLN